MSKLLAILDEQAIMSAVCKKDIEIYKFIVWCLAMEDELNSE